jgi:molybdate transport system ATP-binding protein
MIEIDIIKPLYTADGIINLKVNKKINKGDFLTLFGKSGSGKTTLLRILAGLETPKSGKIVVDKEIWFDSSKKINLAPQKRDVGFVFQDYALFPNMSVKKNLEFALKNKNEIKKVDEILEIMDQKYFLWMNHFQLLDTTMRLKLQDEILTLHKEFKTTTIMVSHDPSEDV